MAHAGLFSTQKSPTSKLLCNIRTYREIKNKFNNGIRKIAKILYAREG